MNFWERLRGMWWMLTHKTNGREYWARVIITKEQWEQEGDAFVFAASRECEAVCDDLRRTMVREWKASRASRG